MKRFWLRVVLDRGFSNLGWWGTLGWPPPHRNPDRVLVGIVGGSFAADVYGDAGDRLRTRLAAVPWYAGRQIQILNLAHGGWKQPQQLFALTWLLSIGGELDCLIDIDGFNEVALDGAENVFRGVFPAYPRGWATRVDSFTDPSQIALTGAVVRRREERAEAAVIFDQPVLRWSPTWNLGWALIDRWASARIGAAERRLTEQRSRRDRFRQTGPTVSLDQPQRLAMLVDVWAQSSIALARLARAYGIDYYQFLQPNQYDDGAKPMGSAERRIAYRADHPYRPGTRMGYPLLRRASARLEAEGIFFTDLSKIFASVETPLFSDDCCHLTKAGYERFADAVVTSMVAVSRRRNAMSSVVVARPDGVPHRLPPTPGGPGEKLP